jgi:hypothetical protein
MLSSEARAFIGQIVQVEHTDRDGNTLIQNAELYDIGFLPLYGPCLLLDIGEIRLDRVASLRAVRPLKSVA